MLLVTATVFFLNALAGPERNPAHAIVWDKKVQTLLHFFETGNAQECEQVLAFIRRKKADSEELLQGHRQAKKEIEAGIRIEEVALQKAPLPIRGVIQGNIEARKDTLTIIHRQETRLTKLIVGRVQEERVFLLLYELTKRVRSTPKDRSLPKP